MRLRTAAKTWAGSVAIYVVVAACSGPGDANGPLTANGPRLGHDGGESGRGHEAGALLDALADPVPDAKADPNSSGSRLKAKRHVGEDGSSEFIGWHDMQRDEDCAFAL